MLGRISLRRIFARRSPSASAARTKSRSTTSSAAPRVSRAMRGIGRSRRRERCSQSLGPTVATARSASTSGGKASMTSMRAHEQVVEPARASRRQRARSCTPSTTPSAVASDRERENRAPPQRKRLSTSRPRLSVPSSASRDGGAYGRPTNLTSAEIDASGDAAEAGPTSAIATSPSTIGRADLRAALRPGAPQQQRQTGRGGGATARWRGWRRSLIASDVRRRGLTRIVEHVGDQVEHDVERREQQRERLDDRHVAVRRRRRRSAAPMPG